MIVDKLQKLLNESESRYCHIYKAKNNKWYVDLASLEGGQDYDANTYGPFDDQDQAEKYVLNNFSNPGGLTVDKSGKKSVPTKSPNGRPITL
jgi:hypothetical protein